MNKVLKYVLVGMLFLLISFCVAVSYNAGKDASAGVVCRRLEVNVADSSRNSFVRTEDIKTLLRKEYGRYLGECLDSLDLCRIERIVDEKSAVLKSQVYVTCDSILHIDISQRQPFVRFQKQGGGFYADKNGFLFPLQNRFSSHVPIVDGAIPIYENFDFKGIPSNPKTRQWVEDMIVLVKYINSDTYWKGNITQIHIRQNGDIVLVPKIGKERFNIGDIKNLDSKFDKIEKYYKAVAPSKEEGYYSYVSVKYEGQIICKR